MADTTPSQDPLRLAEALERIRPEFCGNQATLMEAAALIREQHAALDASQPNAALADGWMDIATAPEKELLLVGWVDPDDTLERHCFDMLEAGCWQAHEADREHFLMVAPPGSRGPKEGAPYTHWKRIGSLPAPPTLNASKGRQP